MNAEGQLIPANRGWNEKNGAYAFSYGLGAVIVLYGLLLCLHPWRPEMAAISSFLVVIMSLVGIHTLSIPPQQ
jgi:uncharacterized membrane protein YkgB